MNIFFCGIGGAGLSALAHLTKQMGHIVSGSDIAANLNTENLSNEGINIYLNQDEKNITKDIDLFIYTSAVNESSPGYNELVKARELNIKAEKREYLINTILKEYISIGISGTHGKTTTTSLLTHCLIELGADPSYLIGGVLVSSGKNANLGKGKFFVWEADEYSNAFHGVNLNYALVNNIDYDHPDFFKNEDDYINSFKYFIENKVSNGLFLNGDDENIKKICSSLNVYPDKIKIDSHVNKDIIIKTYGTNVLNNYAFVEESIIIENNYQNFQLIYDMSESNIISPLLGLHNTYNITAVFSILHSLKFNEQDIVKAIQSFNGVKRRFENIYENNKIKIISDYAHHPTAVKTTIEASKSLSLPVIAIFEPHQLSRLKTLLPQFKEAFKKADIVIVLPIYGARENKVEDGFINKFINSIENKDKLYISSYDNLFKYIIDDEKKNESKKLYLCMTAGPLDDFLRKRFKNN